jgi:hypothetical protein
MTMYKAHGQMHKVLDDQKIYIQKLLLEVRIIHTCKSNEVYKIRIKFNVDFKRKKPANAQTMLLCIYYQLNN